MSQEELITRINTWMAQPMYKNEPYLVELNALYYEITGKQVLCKGCNYNNMKRVLRHYLSNPYTLNKPLKNLEMAKQTQNQESKYQFTTAARNETIVLHKEHGTKAVTADSLTDEDAEMILNSPGLKKAYGHNIEKKAVAEDGAKNAKGKATSEAAKNKPKKAKTTDGDDIDVDPETDVDAETGEDPAE